MFEKLLVFKELLEANKRYISRGEVADKLNISLRQVTRYKMALSTIIQIETKTGKGGGYILVAHKSL